MASGGYRNGASKGTVKVERPLSVNSNIKSSNIKSKPPPSYHASGLRRSSPGSLGGSAGG